MATIIPPASKRQCTAVAKKAREQQEIDTIPKDLGSVRVRFVDPATGQNIGAVVSIPVADSTVKNLESLLNTLQGNDSSERIPYRFTYHSGDSALHINKSIYHTVLKSDMSTTENNVSVQAAPQAIFRVRLVTRCASTIPGHGEAILCAAFSPVSSSRLVTGSGDATARIWDVDTGTPLHTLKGHTGWVLVTSWSPDGSTIATGSNDNTVRLWDPISGKAQGSPLKGHTKRIRSLAWEPYHLQDPGRPRLASSSTDTTVRVWDVAGQKTEHVLSGHMGPVSCVQWGGTGNIYTASHDKTVKIWDASKGTLIQTLSSHTHWVNHLALSTGFVLRTAYHDHNKDIPTTQEEKIKKARERFEKAATINNKIVERLVTASEDFTMYLWEPSETTKPVDRLLGHQKQINHVTFSPDGLWIASSGWDNHVKLWNGRVGTFVTTLRGHVGPVYMSCFTPDSRYLISGSMDTTLKCWNVAQGVLKTDLPGHKDEVFAVDCSPDGGKVASGGKDRAVKTWTH